MNFRNIIAILILCFLSCKNSGQQERDKDNGPDRFDRVRWLARDGEAYLYRNDMLKDLIDNQKLHGLKSAQIKEMLGEPNRSEGNYLYYTIDQTLLGDFPLHTKTLVIKLTADSTVEWRKIHE